MKTRLTTLTGTALLLFLGGCSSVTQVLDGANEVAKVLTTEEEGEKPLTNQEVISGLREALTVGTNNASGMVSKENGFFQNDLIKIPFPEDAIKVKNTLMDLGLNEPVEKFELTLNRAAEEACKAAAPIFVKAITDMSIADGFNILKGTENAATQYLHDKTYANLIAAFSPKVEEAIKTVELTKYWEPLATKYNAVSAFTGGEKVEPDLTAYVTQRATDGLFLMLAEEEKKIRLDPVARVTDILKRVFGSLDD